MILDRQLVVSDGQNITVTAVSTDAIDTAATIPNRDVGTGSEVRMIVVTQLAALAAGAATVTFEIIQADDVALTVNVESLFSTPAIARTAIVAGYVAMDVVLPRTARRFVGVRYTVGTGPLTQGRFLAALVLDADRQRYYASGWRNDY